MAFCVILGYIKLHCFLFQVGREFGFDSNGFSMYLNRNKTGEIQSQSKTLSVLKIKYVEESTVKSLCHCIIDTLVY